MPHCSPVAACTRSCIGCSSPPRRLLPDRVAEASAHPAGARPFARADYIRKFATLAESRIESGEIERFLELVQRLPELTAAELRGLTVAPLALDGEELKLISLRLNGSELGNNAHTLTPDGQPNALTRVLMGINV